MLVAKKYLFQFISVFIFFGFVNAQSGNVTSDGKTVFYYENGNISSEGWMRDGKPDGFWKTYYENGILKSEGKRSEFLLDSTWNFYDDKGNISLIINYLNGKKNGKRIQYQQDGRIEEYFVNDVKQGLTKYYYASGKLKKTIPFDNGLENGIAYVFDENDGRIIQILRYKKGFLTDVERINFLDSKGRKHGQWKWFYKQDTVDYAIPLIVKYEGKFKNGKRHGYFKTYDRQGNLVNTEKYENNILIENPEELLTLDIKKEYYSDGKVKIEASFKDGKAEGWRKEFDPNGKIKKAYIFHQNQKIAEGKLDTSGFKTGYWKEYYLDGILKSEGSYIAGKKSGLWKYYHPNGQLEQTGSYNNRGKEDKQWTWYYPDGSLHREEYYFNGVQDGHSIELFPDGKVITEGEYIEGKKNGKWILDYGDHREEGEYSDDKRKGKWIFYFPNGQINFEGSFIDDLPNGWHTWYWPTAVKKMEGKYTMGLKTGRWTKYNPDGTTFIVIYYKAGKEIKVEDM
jgi:antitoxin component YwqK of YwqJK toxin-antitoxin module